MHTQLDSLSLLMGFLCGLLLVGGGAGIGFGRALLRKSAKLTALQMHLTTLQGESQALTLRLAERESQVRDAEQLAQEAQQAHVQTQQILNRLEVEVARWRSACEEKERHFQAQQKSQDANAELMKTTFENLANQVLEQKGLSFQKSSQGQMETLLGPLRQQLERFEGRINAVHADALKAQSSLSSEIRRVSELGVRMSEEAHALSRALKGDKKTVGNWGEAQLERTLELGGLIKGEHYQPQASFRDTTGKRAVPDFLIKLPDNKHLIIDAKASLVDYERAVAAQTPEELAEALKRHVQAVKNHMDDLSAKDYTALPGVSSPSFVLMFMPIEAAFVAALSHDKMLYDYGYERGIILVSYTTLLPVLRTVSNLWMIQRSHEQVAEISARAGEIFNQVCVVAERVQKLGVTLGTVSRHYNSVVTAVAGQQGLSGKVERFDKLSAKSAKRLLALEPLHIDLETEKVAMVAQAIESAES